MSRQRATSYLLVAFFGFLSPPVNAQFNLKSGYNISFMSNPGLNALMADFNATQPYTTAFTELSWVHGFELGIRHKMNSNSLELIYQGGYQVLKASGDLNGGGEPFTDNMRFGVNSIALGYQFSGERAGLGVDIQYQWYNTKVELSREGGDFKDVQYMPATRFYLMLNFPSFEGVDIAIQPYYILPFNSFDYDPLSEFLQQTGEYISDTWNRYGITIAFYNGEK